MSPIGKVGMSMMLATLGLCASASPAAAQTLATLVSFDGTDGADSTAGLIRATDGNFYGTTSGGGANSDGTVFRITPSGVLTTLYSFCSQSACSDGADPLGGVIQAKDGNLYGTTELGNVFKITLSGTFTSLGGTGGLEPAAGLVQGTDGDFYGTTSHGGANTCALRAGYHVSCGTVFKITPTGTATTLASFSQADGFYSLSPLIQATDGNFYGTTARGGGTLDPGDGTVFKITPTGTLTVLHSFEGTDGETPLGALVQGTDGNFYGTTSFGGANSGFAGITPTGTFTTLHSFGSGDGAEPSAALIQATDGNFYGTTSGSGFGLDGTVFKITPSGTFTTLFTFAGTDGETPLGRGYQRRSLRDNGRGRGPQRWHGLQPLRWSELAPSTDV
jgi:uncharacterized repeat protein (TIGR03803 family)